MDSDEQDERADASAAGAPLSVRDYRGGCRREVIGDVSDCLTGRTCYFYFVVLCPPATLRAVFAARVEWEAGR